VRYSWSFPSTTKSVNLRVVHRRLTAIMSGMTSRKAMRIRAVRRHVIDTVRHCRERKRLWLGSSAARDVGRPESSSSTRRTEPGGRIKRRPEVGIPDGRPQDGRIRACAESTSDFGVEEMLAPCTLLRSRLVLVGFETREQLVLPALPGEVISIA